MRLTIVLAFLIAVSFLALSGNPFFAEEESLLQFGFSLSKLWNVIAFSFVHTGYSHLLSNLAMVLGAGFALEKIVRRESYLALFFGGAAVSGVLTLLLRSGYVIVGSSAGAVSLLTAALAVSPKASLKNMAVLFVAGNLLILGANSLVEGEKSAVVDEIRELEAERETAIETGNTERAVAVERGIGQKLVQKREIEEGIELGKIPVNFEVHFFAAALAALYIFFFERPAFRRTVKGELSFIHKAVLKR